MEAEHSYQVSALAEVVVAVGGTYRHSKCNEIIGYFSVQIERKNVFFYHRRWWRRWWLIDIHWWWRDGHGTHQRYVCLVISTCIEITWKKAGIRWCS